MISYVVITGRTGGHIGAQYSIVSAASKKDAYAICEKSFRKNNNLASQISLQSTSVFEGTEKEAMEFYLKLDHAIKDKENKEEQNAAS